MARFSYAGQVTFGITADADAVPGTAVLAEVIGQEVRTLREAAR